MSKFFCKSAKEFIEVQPSLTPILCFDKDSNSIVTRVLELENDPLKALEFTDFSIAECIRHGVSYKALNISPNLRLNHEAEFNQLNNRLEEVADSLFVKSEN